DLSFFCSPIGLVAVCLPAQPNSQCRWSGRNERPSPATNEHTQTQECKPTHLVFAIQLVIILFCWIPMEYSIVQFPETRQRKNQRRTHQNARVLQDKITKS